MEDFPLRGDALRARLKELGMTQTDLAIGLGISTQAVQHWVAGRSGPSSGLVPKVIEMLQLEVETSPVDQRLNKLSDEVNQLRDAVVALAQQVERLTVRQTGAAAADPATRPAKDKRRSK